MKINRDRLETIGAIISVIFIISLFTFAPKLYFYFFDIKTADEIKKTGNCTVGFVYGLQGKYRHAEFYYFLGSKKLDGYSTCNSGINPLTKFYKVYYIPNEKQNSFMDFSFEIPPDYVQYYFPAGENPFEEEVKNVKEGNYVTRDIFGRIKHYLIKLKYDK